MSISKCEHRNLTISRKRKEKKKVYDSSGTRLQYENSEANISRGKEFAVAPRANQAGEMYQVWETHGR